ncbi:MAG: hypothetical protein L3J39_00265 [Verrucomicrobiales bacterium]|nr:hypothetical protein [Verrucomicrobiales bacterium]
MNRLTLPLIAFGLVSCSNDDGGSSTGDANTSIQNNFAPVVADAWQGGGALVGRLIVSGYGNWQYFEEQPNHAPPLPVFVWRDFEPGMLANLPAPSAPFAISFGGSAMNDEGLKELAGLQNLQSLDISHTQVTDAGLGQLAANKNLQNLDLGASSVTDAGLKQLATVKSLRKLYFGSTAVTDAGLKELVGLEKLELVYLYNTKVTDAGLKELLKIKSLKTLILSKTEVTDEGLEEFSQARPEVQIMR